MRLPRTDPLEAFSAQGAGRKVLLHALPLTAPDSSTLLRELVSDVTQPEALRMRVLHSERLAAIGEMAPRVAHEVRNPRGVLTVPTDLARRELGPGGDLAQAEAHREVVTDAIGHGAGLVQSDLQFGRPSQLRETGIT